MAPETVAERIARRTKEIEDAEKQKRADELEARELQYGRPCNQVD